MKKTLFLFLAFVALVPGVPGQTWRVPLLQSREAVPNLSIWPESFNDWSKINAAPVTANSAVAPDGRTTADTVEDNGGFIGIHEDVSVSDDSTWWTWSIFVKKDSDQARFPEVQLQLNGGTTTQKLGLQVNTETGALITREDVGSTKYGGKSFDANYWRVWVTVKNNSTGNVTVRMLLLPAVSTAWGGFETGATGSAVFWGTMLTNTSKPVKYSP